MDFEQLFLAQKKSILSRKDNSKKGEIDKRVVKLIDEINSLDNFYTTSSCAGRIMAYGKESEKKFDTKWIFVSHEPIKFSSLKLALQKLPQCPVWLREEPMILHVCAKTLDDGQKILNLARECGFKRSGIMATERRVMIEFTGTEIMDTIIADAGKMIVDEKYVKRLALEANKKLKRNFTKIKKLEEKIKELKK